MIFYTRFLVFSLCLLILKQASADSIHLTTSLPGASSLTCRAYIFANANATKNLPIVFSQSGTGIYSIGDWDKTNSLIESLIQQNKAIVVAIDKPGIEYMPGLSQNFSINDTAYNAHTQRDLIACMGNAIKWVSSQDFSSSTSKIYILGHSEGSQVATRFYQKALSENPEIAKRIKSIFLSGVVMQDWSDLNNLPPKESQIFWQAYQNHDDKNLREYGQDLAYAYWNDILGTEPMSQTYKELALRAPPATFQILQGLNDQVTILKPILDFESWNTQQKNAQQPHLLLAARYYFANHGLNETAFDDMYTLLINALNEEPKLVGHHFKNFQNHRR